MKMLNGIFKQRYSVVERPSMTTDNFARVTELEKYLREELHEITQGAKERAAQVIAGAIRRLRMENERTIDEIQ